MKYAGRSGAVCSLLLFIAFAGTVNGQTTHTWLGTFPGQESVWNNNANWNPATGGAGPTTSMNLVFNNVGSATSVVTLAGGTETGNAVQFSQNTGYTLGTSAVFDILTLGGGAGSSSFIRNDSSATQNIDTRITFNSTPTTRTIENTAAGQTNFSGAVTSNGALAVTKSAAGSIVFASTVGAGANAITVTNSNATGLVAFNGGVTASAINLSGAGTVRFGDATGDAFASAVSVGSGALMEGIGTVSGLTTIASGGRYGAGQTGISNGIGTQNLAGGLTFQNNANFAWDMSTTSVFDQVTVGGAGLTIGTGFQTQINFTGAAPVVGQFWDVFTGSSITGVNATNLLAGTFTAPSGVFQWSVVGGNVGRITAVPEPSSMALLGMAGLIGGVYARRRAKKNKV